MFIFAKIIKFPLIPTYSFSSGFFKCLFTCLGLFMFTKEVPLPKIEIYRHSIGTDSPDILHMEDFKNTKVVDLHFHRGHFVAKKSVTKKKTVTFKDRC